MFFNRLQHLPTRFFDGHRVGEIMSRFQDLKAAMGAVGGGLETVLLRGSYLILVPPVLFWLSWKLALLSLVTLPITTASSIGIGRILRRRHKAGAEAYADLTALQFECLTHVRTLKAVAAERRIYAAVRQNALDAQQLRLAAAGLGTLLGLANGTIRAAGQALFMWIGWSLILRGEITLGGFLAFMAYQAYMIGPLNQFASMFVGFQQTAVHLDRAFEYLDQPVEQDPNLVLESPQPLQCAIQGALRLDRVSFGYAPGQVVLHDITLNVASGETLAIVGSSGTGKSG